MMFDDVEVKNICSMFLVKKVQLEAGSRKRQKYTVSRVSVEGKHRTNLCKALC